MNSILLLYFVSFLSLFSTDISHQVNVYYIHDKSENGSGSLSSPFNNFELAIRILDPGDTLLVLPGDYPLPEALYTQKNGTVNKRITIKGFDKSNPPRLVHKGRVMKIKHAYNTIDGLILDGQFGEDILLYITDNANNTVIRNCEVKNGQRNGIVITGVNDILIENTEIHHLLRGTWENYEDAHGISASKQMRLRISGCNIHHVSGDCFQTDPNMTQPAWDTVWIEKCKLWTGPLEEDAAGFKKGQVPGENALDTKTDPIMKGNSYRGVLIVKNIEAFGFINDGYIPRRSVFNIKHQTKWIMENIRVHHAHIAFRISGNDQNSSTYLELSNCVGYDNDILFRCEFLIEGLKLYNCTFDAQPGSYYFAEYGTGLNRNGFEMKNCLFMHSTPDGSNSILQFPLSIDPSNMAASMNFFIDSSHRNYHLNEKSPAINKGSFLSIIKYDIEGHQRTKDDFDVGAYEYQFSNSNHK